LNPRFAIDHLHSAFGGRNIAVWEAIERMADIVGFDRNSGVGIESETAMVDIDLMVAGLDNTADLHTVDLDTAALGSIVGLDFDLEAADFGGIAGQEIDRLHVDPDADVAHLVRL
jgi:hypothetical protein